MKKYIAELIGTFTLVFLGCGAFVFTLSATGALVVVISALTFGFALAGIYNGIAKISGAHINPAVTLGAFAADRMKAKDTVFYIIAQFIGGLLGALGIYLIAIGNSSYELSYGLGENGFGTLSLGNYSMISAIIFELIATFLFVYLFLGTTYKKNKKSSAAVTLGLFYAGAVMVGFLITGASLNPARSFGPGFIVGFANHEVWVQLPLFILVPAIAGLLAGLMFKFKVTHGKSKKKKDKYKETDETYVEEVYVEEEEISDTTGTEFGENDEIEVIEE